MGNGTWGFAPAGPVLACRRARGGWKGEPEGTAGAFAGAEGSTMRQAWLATPQERFLPSTVRCVRSETTLWVLADLQDLDIHNPITEFNAPAFATGDAFEMFFRPPRQEAYYEFHVSPLNQLFQLRIPRQNRPAEAQKIAEYRIESRVRLMPERNRWEVLAGIPFARVAEAGPVRDGDRWLFSFSRYDYTRGHEGPVLSSTSPHSVAGFHTQEDWGQLVMC
jgi:hypothetical protein